MFNDDYINRVNIEQISSFILNGDGLKNLEEGTPEERRAKYSKDFDIAMCNYRDKVISYDWSKCKTADEKFMVSEEFWQDVIDAKINLQEFYYYMGFQAGLSIQSKL